MRASVRPRPTFALALALAIGASACGAREPASDDQALGPLPHAHRPCCAEDTTLADGGPTGPGRAATRIVMTLSEDGRWTACGYRIRDAEGLGATLLCDGGRIVSHVPGALPVAWEPGGGRLLLHEAVPDDDVRHFVLDVAGGELAPTGERLGRIVGDRAARLSAWRNDTLWFTSALEPGAPARPVALDRRGRPR